MSKKYNLKLKGYVGGWDFDSDYVDWFLSKHKDEEVTICIDSLGGSTVSAMSIAAAFKLHGNVNVHYVGYNASAATIASMGAKHVSIDCNAMYLVHKCSTWVCQLAQANADDMNRMITELDKSRRELEKIDLNIASMYAQRCKKTKAELLDLMAEGGWLSATEALAWGFVDEVTDQMDDEATVINEVVASMMSTEGIPMPPGLEAKRPGLLRRLAEAWVSMFEQKRTNFQNNMAKILPLVCSVLGLETLEFANGFASVTYDQASQLENALSKNDSRIAELEAQVAQQAQEIDNLKKVPADDTTNVVAEGNTADEQDEYTAVAKRARDMFNAIR